MAKTIKVTTDNKVILVDVDFNDFHSINEAIGGHFETVRTQDLVDFFGDTHILMLCDDEGRCKDLPINAFASGMYGFQRHGNPIAGDIILAVQDGENLLAPANVQMLKEKIRKTLIQEEV